MAVSVKKLERIFLFNGQNCETQTRNSPLRKCATCMSIPTELATAAIEGPTPVNGAMQYVFTCAVGAKG